MVHAGLIWLTLMLGAVANDNVPAPVPAPVLPDEALTPGDTFPVTLSDLCAPGYTEKVRNVPDSMKRAVFRRYGVPYAEHANYEIDHLVPLELGGSNSIKNLWPETYLGEWNARRKDVLETHLHHLVCQGKLDLTAAQWAISHNWIAAYQFYVAPESPQIHTDMKSEAPAATRKQGLRITTRTERRKGIVPGHITGTLAALKPGQKVELLVYHGASIHQAAKILKIKVHARKLRGQDGVEAWYQVKRERKAVAR